jgi:hypothetical protein
MQRTQARSLAERYDWIRDAGGRRRGLVVGFVFLGHWIIRRINDYPATLFGPLEPPPPSS